MLQAFMEKIRSIEGEMKDIPQERLEDFMIYACFSSTFFLSNTDPTQVILAALSYGYIMRGRDSVNLDDLE
jgi:hypothetical protein